MTMHEEYTDYSCSTAVERLGRDVETVLRAWHVDKGSDHHVSVPSAASGTSGWTCPLIRSNTLIWHVPVTTRTGRSSVTIDLELALWDEPPAMQLQKASDPTQPEDPTNLLVRSLRCRHDASMPSPNVWFDNFSLLFGMGQHISLTPIQADPIPQDLIDFVGANILERHDDSSTAPFVFGAALGAWLQTALNTAVANCHCAIPAIGLWGSYHPNKLPTASRTRPKLVATTATGSRSNKDEWSVPSALDASTQHDWVGATIQMAPSEVPPPESHGIPVFPHWAQAIRNVNLPAVARAYQRRARSQFWNQRHIPPLVFGTVTASYGTPINLPAMGASFWVAAAASTEHFYSGHLPNRRNHTPTIAERTGSSSRLSVWGAILLQQCPGENSCVLGGARHVYGWFKPQLQATGILSSLLGNASATRDKIQEWRLMNLNILTTPKPDETEFDAYRKHCQFYFLDLLEECWSGNQVEAKSSRWSSFSSQTEKRSDRDILRTPVWGSLDDPVASVVATVTWNGKASFDHHGNKIVEPLLTLPYRIRSRRKLSSRDWVEMEESVERTILDPFQPSRFVVQVHFDRDTSVATLAGNQRSILAALIRAATLPGETLLSHLTDAHLVELWDDHAGTIVANKLASKAKVASTTQAIVEAMDWSNIMSDMISMEEAEEIVHEAMKGELMAGFPSSTEDSFLDREDLSHPFSKAAPFGRLLSILFAQMARTRALSSMALVWSVFVQELRRRWESREALPNMQYVAGLDPHPLELYKRRTFSSIGHKADFSGFLNCSEPDPDDYHCLIGQKLQVFNVGIECIMAGEMLEHEIMERFLEQGQVPTSAKHHMTSNTSEGTPSVTPTIGEEKGLPGKDMLTHDPLPVKRSKWPKAKSTAKYIPDRMTSFSAADPAQERADYGPPAINSDLEFWVMDEPGYAPRDEGMAFVSHAPDDTMFDFVAQVPAELDETAEVDESTEYRRKSSILIDGVPDMDTNGWEGTIMDGDDDNDDNESGTAASRNTSGSLSQAYFDTAEAGSIFSEKNGFVGLDTVFNSADMKRRPGARCPVQGVTLRNTGDQLYAPYLQRPSPMTDDLVLERKHMLASEKRESEERKTVLTARINLAHRLQEPKLLSDMSAFKAANPNATFDDFTGWYGNPGSPLDDYDDEVWPDDISMSGAFYESAAKKLDRATEAMKVLTSMRDFWASTWEKAVAVPAAEQHPLFDYESTVEMTMDFLEQMHPANLVNQIMAVNLASSYFALVTSADDALNVDIVKASIKKLRKKVERALQLLSDDATGALFQTNTSDNASTSTATANQYISEEAIGACEEACNAIAVTETLLARAISLLSKLPSQYTLVQDLLRLSDGTAVALIDPSGRKSLLDAIREQQMDGVGLPSSESNPKPALREYVLRNLDDEKPSQLSVRFGDPDVYSHGNEGEGGVVLALLKSYSD
eukprot:Nitzschia sp. Nitz4//scaffold49_size126201//67010//71320//NITZ4_003646-RA/size126201-processed-gene-0.98-mRNA-1//-1//CDS//3329553161//8430//frame0